MRLRERNPADSLTLAAREVDSTRDALRSGRRFKPAGPSIRQADRIGAGIGASRLSVFCPLRRRLAVRGKS